MVEHEEPKDDAEEVAVPLAPGQLAMTYDLPEEPYGWVVCIAMHLINGFTWGIIAVGVSLLLAYPGENLTVAASPMEFTCRIILTTIYLRAPQTWTTPSLEA
jgi:hypothetical protein